MKNQHFCLILFLNYQKKKGNTKALARAPMPKLVCNICTEDAPLLGAPVDAHEEKNYFYLLTNYNSRHN